MPIPEDILLQLQLEFPWLTLDQIRHMLQTKTTVGGHGGGEGGQSNIGSSGSSSRPVEQDIPEDVVAKVVAHLTAMRQEIAQADGSTSYFKIRVLGVGWSIKLFGKTVKDIACSCKDKSTETWCHAVGWPKVCSFAVNKYRGVDNCKMLAEELRRRGDLFMTCWQDAGAPSGFSFEECKHAYKSTDEYSDWCNELAIGSEFAKVAFEIIDLCPRPVPP